MYRRSMNAGTSTLRTGNLCPNFNLIRQRRGPLLEPHSIRHWRWHMWKTILAGTTALAIAGGTLAYAQAPDHGPRGPHWRPSAADIGAFADARVAALHAGLKLTPDQEKNWPAVETALRDLAKVRSDRLAARASADKPKDPVERMKARAEAMESRGAAMKKLADAAGPLYASLDDAQKHRFIVLARLEHPFARGWRHGHHGARGEGMRMHRGFGPGPMGPDTAPRPQ